MTEAGGTSEADESTRKGLSSLDRRAMLKGAAAAGAGLAAWSAPSIKTLGFTPAYAQVCTVGFTKYAAIKGNIDAGQERYKDPTPLTCAGEFPPIPGTAELRVTDCATIPGNPGQTGSPTLDLAGVCIDAPSLNGQYCKLEIQFLDSQGPACDLGPSDLSSDATVNPLCTPSALITGPTFLGFPEANISSALKYRVFAICSTDELCLPTGTGGTIGCT